MSHELKRLFVAPHLDDSAISLGGTLLGERASTTTQTLVATVFTRSSFTREGLGDPAKVTPIRQAEEKTMMGSIGVETVFLDFPECPLRGHTISHPLDYPRQIKPDLDEGVVEQVAAALEPLVEGADEMMIPLAIGANAHVDHRIVRKAGLLVWQRQPTMPVRVYEDVLYITQAQLEAFGAVEGAELMQTSIDLEAKLQLAYGYASQPIELLEELIRNAAGEESVERAWRINGERVLEFFASNARTCDVIDTNAE